MGAPTITMDVRRVGETTAVVDIRGDVTAACEPVLMSAYEAAGGSATNRLVLNFAGLEYMNSGGIGMLVTLLVRANRQHQQLAGLRAERALPRDLRADQARRGDHHLRQRGIGAQRRR